MIFDLILHNILVQFAVIIVVLSCFVTNCTLHIHLHGHPFLGTSDTVINSLDHLAYMYSGDVVHNYVNYVH